MRRVVGDSDDVDDLVQEVLIRLWRRLGQAGGLTVPAWLAQVAHNVAVDSVRRPRAVVMPADRLDRPVGSTEEVAGVNELRRAVAAAFRQLPPHHRAALVGAEQLRGNPQELARELGVSVRAAESRVRRARLALGRRLAVIGVTDVAVAAG